MDANKKMVHNRFTGRLRPANCYQSTKKQLIVLGSPFTYFTVTLNLYRIIHQYPELILSQIRQLSRCIQHLSPCEKFINRNLNLVGLEDQKGELSRPVSTAEPSRKQPDFFPYKDAANEKLRLSRPAWLPFPLSINILSYHRLQGLGCGLPWL